MPTHLALAVGRIFGQSARFDTVYVAPAVLTTLFWLPSALIVLTINLRNQRSRVIAECASMGAVISTADYLIVDPWTAPLPSITESFMEQPLIEGSRTRLFTRIDQPQDFVQVGSDLELLRQGGSRIETVDEQHWLIQQLHWRDAQTPPVDQALALQVLDNAGSRAAHLDVPVNDGTSWQPNGVTTNEYWVPLPTNLESGTFRLAATVYSLTTGMTLVHSMPLPPVSKAP